MIEKKNWRNRKNTAIECSGLQAPCLTECWQYMVSTQQRKAILIHTTAEGEDGVGGHWYLQFAGGHGGDDDILIISVDNSLSSMSASIPSWALCTWGWATFNRRGRDTAAGFLGRIWCGAWMTGRDAALIRGSHEPRQRICSCSVAAAEGTHPSLGPVALWHTSRRRGFPSPLWRPQRRATPHRRLQAKGTTRPPDPRSEHARFHVPGAGVR